MVDRREGERIYRRRRSQRAACAVLARRLRVFRLLPPPLHRRTRVVSSRRGDRRRRRRRLPPSPPRLGFVTGEVVVSRGLASIWLTFPLWVSSGRPEENRLGQHEVVSVCAVFVNSNISIINYNIK